MSKSVFQYVINGPVGVPGIPYVVGTVIGRCEYKHSEPGYLIEWSTSLDGTKSEWFEQTKVDRATGGLAAPTAPSQPTTIRKSAKPKRKR